MARSRPRAYTFRHRLAFSGHLRGRAHVCPLRASLLITTTVTRRVLTITVVFYANGDIPFFANAPRERKTSKRRGSLCFHTTVAPNGSPFTRDSVGRAKLPLRATPFFPAPSSSVGSTPSAASRNPPSAATCTRDRRRPLFLSRRCGKSPLNSNAPVVAVPPGT